LEAAVSDDADAVGHLIAQARAGSTEALEELMGRYRPYVGLLVQHKGGGRLQARVDASDIVQETLLQAARNIGQFAGNGEEEWRAWLARIAEREVIHQVRHHAGAAKRAVGREQPLATGPGSASSAFGVGQELAASQTSPSVAAVRGERSAMLADALDALPADYREVLILRHVEALDFPEVAKRMQRSAGAVRVLWTRALKRLREELARLGPFDSQLPPA
jgi:RNA polymerase sigma-70 factor (ECF subfamily)